MLHKLPRWIWVGGAILACVAGMVNAIAFLSFTHQAATHMTGIFTHLSIGLFDRDSAHARNAALMLGSFFAGAMACGMIIHDGHLKMGRRYGLALALEAALLAGATAGFMWHSLWGERLAAMAAGLQNAMVSTYSGSIVRTTHMTGILTDLGAIAGQAARGLKVDLLRFRLLATLALSFVGGGILGVLTFGRWGYLAMLVPAAAVGCTSAGYLVIRRMSFWNQPVNPPTTS